LDVFGMSGIDRACIQAKKLEHPNGDLGYVGQVTYVKTGVFTRLLEDNVFPILSPICYGPGGSIFNVNADHVALALAVALAADELVFLTNVPGVLKDEVFIPKLSPAEAETLIGQGIIAGGMIPKVRSALEAVAGGVNSVRITDLDGLSQGTGTTITNDELFIEAEVEAESKAKAKAEAKR
jgi:acetylglutamate kinase